MFRHFIRMLPLLLLLLTSAGCGYHLAGQGLAPAEGPKSLQVQIFANKSYKSNIEGVLADSIADRLARRRDLWLVNGDGAELMLSGTVLAYTLTPVSYSKNDLIADYRATVRIEAVLTRSSDGAIVWKRQMALSQTFPMNTTIPLQQNSEEAAIREICRKLAEQVYVGMLEDF